MDLKRLALAASLAGLAQPALAQTALAQTPESAAAATEETIIVTATKRAARLADVPASIVAVTGTRLEQLNLSTATDLQYITPGLGLGDANTPRGAGLRIRGVGTNVFADGIEQSVGTVIDGVPLARAGQGLVELADVERVEVLRGPQGMLFGRNASAGLINVVTRAPTEELSYILNASVASDNEQKIGGSVAGPLLPGLLRARLTGFSNTRDGIVKNLATGSDLNDQSEHGFRGALMFTPMPSLDLTLRADWSQRDTNCCIWTVRRFATPAENPPGSVLLSSFAGASVVAAQGPENRVVNQTGDPFNTGESSGVSAEINARVGEYTITSITARRTWDQFDGLDSDQTALNVLDINFGSNTLEQVSQELRLTSPDAGRIRYVAGLFYFDATNDNFSRQSGRFTAQLAAAQAAGVTIPLSTTLSLPPTANFGRDVTTTISTRDIAAFGEATIDITDRLRGIVGARYTDTEV